MKLICIPAVLFLTVGLNLAGAQEANRTVVIEKTDMRDIVERMAKHSGQFKEEFNKAVEHSLIDGTKLEDRAKHRADDFHDAAKKLEDVYKDKGDKSDRAVRSQADKVLSAASDISHVMQEHRFTDRLQRLWEDLRSD